MKAISALKDWLVSSFLLSSATPNFPSFLIQLWQGEAAVYYANNIDSLKDILDQFDEEEARTKIVTRKFEKLHKTLKM